METAIESAIIGYYRNGMSLEAICFHSDTPYIKVVDIIENYLKVKLATA